MVKGLVSWLTRSGWRFAVVLLFGGCTHERVLVSGAFYTLSVVAGDAQTAPAGSLLPVPLQVLVRDGAGAPVKSTIVVFRVTDGAADGAVVADSLSVTDELGVAQAEVRLGARAGSVVVLAFPIEAGDRAITFRATATGGPSLAGVLPAAVGPGDTLSLAGTSLGGVSSTVEFGSVRVKAVSGNDAALRVVVPDCLSAGSVNVRVLVGAAWTAPRTVTYTPSRRPLALRSYEAVLIGADELAGCAALATDADAEFVVIPQLASQGASPTAMTVRVTTGVASVAALFGAQPRAFAMQSAEESSQTALDNQLRESERLLAPSARGPSEYPRPMAALAVGSLRTFEVIASLDASQFTTATGQLRWTGEHLAIYVDTTTATAYSDAELDGLGRLFDVDLYRTALAAFGPESDIDHNGKVLVFLTPRVNALVAAADCGQRGFVTGFFYGRDLLPTDPHSNGGEIFYSLVPDVEGRYSCAHSSADVQRLVPGTFVHEMQHMISFFHHVIARGGAPEENWINEGLSHIAEELASRVFETRYPPPLNRSTTEQLFPDSSASFIAPQMLNAYVYLYSSPSHSVTTFNGTGSLEERGAAWLFLRWLGDQKGESIYRRLVQTSLTGIANVEARAGEPFARLFGDFATAIWADSIPGVARNQVASRYRFLSRNLRQLMAREATVSGFSNPWPAGLIRIPYAGYAEGPLLPGTMVYAGLGPYGAGQGPMVLNFFKPSGAFVATDGAQLGILRVR